MVGQPTGPPDDTGVTQSGADTGGGAGAGEETDPLVGRIFKGAYQLESLIGEGGMGSVYRAKQLVVGREVAVKVLRPQMVLNERTRKSLVQRFEREARATSQLNHPNTVRLFDFGKTEDGMLFLALELLKGAVLSAVLDAEGRLPPARVAAIAHQVCRSLAEAHGHGIIHRDLKPDNVFLCVFDDQQDFVKVVDFGIARVAEGDGSQSVTATGATVGTPAYMAPEQAMANAEAISPATDLYSLGIMIYEMLTGAPPFLGETFMQVALQHLQGEPGRLEIVLTEGGVSFNRDIVAAWQALLDVLLAKDPADRPQSAKEVADTLKSLERMSAEARVRTQPDGKSLSNKVSRAAVNSALGRTQNQARISAPEITMGEQPGVRPPARRKRRKALLLAAAVVLVAGGIGAFLATQGATSNAAPKLDSLATAATTSQGAASEAPGAGVEAATKVDEPPMKPDTPLATAKAGGEAAPEPEPPPAEVAPAAPEAAPTTARLVLTSTPPGARVLRGDIALCTTPCDDDVPPGDGEETLRLELAEHDAGEVTVTLAAGARIEQTVTLAAVAAPSPKERRTARKKPKSRVTKKKATATVAPAPMVPKTKTTPAKTAEKKRTKRKLLKFSTADPTGK